MVHLSSSIAIGMALLVAIVGGLFADVITTGEMLIVMVLANGYYGITSILNNKRNS